MAATSSFTCPKCRFDNVWQNSRCTPLFPFTTLSYLLHLSRFQSSDDLRSVNNCTKEGGYSKYIALSPNSLTQSTNVNKNKLCLYYFQIKMLLCENCLLFLALAFIYNFYSVMHETQFVYNYVMELTRIKILSFIL